jgi:hypothetical protein
MTWSKAKKSAVKAFPQLKPSRPGGFAVFEDCLIISGYDEKVSIVLHGTADLERLGGFCQLMVKKRKEKKNK